MLIGIHDADKDPMTTKRRNNHNTFPNLALMKISAWHKYLGDTVVWWEPLITSQCDLIYSSKVFDFTPNNPYLPPTAIRGGTGYIDLPPNKSLPQAIDDMYPDYSIYPDCDYAIGYLTRGCINRCRWCVVPAKEGNIHPYRTWEQIVRPDSKKLVLMDNNILACEHGISQLESLIGSGYAIDLNQGMDARLVDEQVADIIARLDWIRFIRFSCDQKSQIEAIMHVASLLEERGLRPYHLFVYLLVTADIDDAAYRVEQLKQLKGINIYAQAERNTRLGIVPNADQLEFAQRYVYGGSYRTITWHEYSQKKENG